jgi:hypothetical protein
MKMSVFYFRFFRLIKIGITVVITFILCWLPFLSSVDSAYPENKYAVNYSSINHVVDRHCLNKLIIIEIKKKRLRHL